MHACTGTMYIRTCVHRVLCTHVVYVVVRMVVKQLPCTSSSMCACRILFTAQPSVGRIIVWVMAMHMDLYYIPLPSTCWAIIHNCGIDLVRAHVVLRHCVNCNIGSICCIQCHLVQDPVSS